MTNKRSRKRPTNQWRGLKATLVVGSMAATLLGTRQIAQTEAISQPAATTAVTVPVAQVQTIPVENSAPMTQAQIDQRLQELRAQQPVIRVQPVTRSRSSR